MLLNILGQIKESKDTDKEWKDDKTCNEIIRAVKRAADKAVGKRKKHSKKVEFVVKKWLLLKLNS